MDTTVSRKPWRMSYRVAEDLRRQILRGAFDREERLPSVPALAAQLGISQHHLREALRLLEQDNLVRVVSGRNGGIFIDPPERGSLTRSFGLVLARSGTLLKDLMQARAVIEPSLASLASTEATDDDLSLIAHILDSHSQPRTYRPGGNAEFHLAVAAATHNQTLLTMMTAMEQLLLSLDARVGRRSADLDGADLVGESFRAHRAIFRALQSHNSEQAASLTLRHVLGYQDAIAATGIDLATYEIADLIDDLADAPSIKEIDS
jgi:DNA-binding FadR family transcriptional regulator